MNRGCICVGEIKCDSCQELIEQGEMYLLMEEEDEGKGDGKKSRFCAECCAAKGYAAYKEEKGEKVLTFFLTSLNSE